VRPLAVDLCSGLGGWAEGLEAEGWDVIRVDIEDMFAATGTPKPDPCLLVLQDVLTIHGSQFTGVDLIVGSSPCQEFSYRAMPWKRAKALTPADVGVDEPEWWKKPEGKMTAAELAEWRAWRERWPSPPPTLGMELFNAQFRIQREASQAAGRHIPMVVENVKGAQPWVGRSRGNYGSFYFWGDVPALMPYPSSKGVKVGGMGWYPPDDPRWKPGQGFNTLADRQCREEDARKNAVVGGGSWFAIGGPGQTVTGANPDGRKVPGFRFDGSGRSFQTASVDGQKANGGGWFNDGTDPNRMAAFSSKSSARKAASARIAKIPERLSRYVGRVYRP